jgi:hypothetical protein
VRDGKYRHYERKEVNVRPISLEEKELLDLIKREGRVFNKRLWFSTEFAVAVTAWLAHYFIHHNKDCRKTTYQSSLLSPSDHAVAPPPLYLTVPFCHVEHMELGVTSTSLP